MSVTVSLHLAFDITGLQTFSNGANTMSNWGWHQFPTQTDKDRKILKDRNGIHKGRMVRYDVLNP